MLIRDLRIDPPVAVAPMSGITDGPFRRLCREAGAALAYTGLVSANALKYASDKTLGLLAFAEDDHPVGAQIFGADPEVVAAAAARAAERGADIVDINMGCSVPKVLKARAGVALMADPYRAEAMVRAAVRAGTGVPVTVKIRRGWQDRGEEAAAFAQRLAGAGAGAICVHPRWATQGFRGSADWAVIARVKQSVSIPVIGSGDVRTGDDALRMVRETGCDGVMVGRASLGRPWVFAEIAAAFRGEPCPPAPSPEVRLELAARHLALVVAEVGEGRAVREMRKHFAWYLKAMPRAAALRDQVNQKKSQAGLLAVLDQARQELAAAADGNRTASGAKT